MNVFSGLSRIPHTLNDPVVTWGVFDGMHRGHRQVVRDVVRWARQTRSPSLVITFDPHPVRVLTGQPVALLCSLDRRLERLSEFGVDHGLVVRFTRAFARTDAEDFVRRIVVGRLHAHRLVLGYDSMFGRDRRGNVALLRRLARELDLEVRACRPVRVSGRIVSSSVIRAAIAAGDLRTARTLLGYGPSLGGVVVRGAGRGRTLGIPTANLNVRTGVVPPCGVYATRVRLNGGTYKGVVNIGMRPTFEPDSVQPVVEVHILDIADRALYRKEIGLDFLFKIRDEKRFDSADGLREQIRKDIERARG